MPESSASTVHSTAVRASWFATIAAFLVGTSIAAFAVWLVFEGKTPDDNVPSGLFFGRFHPFVLHLPIGGMAYLACVELVRLFKRRDPARVPVLWFVALSAALAAFLGWLLGTSGDYSADRNFQDHLQWSLAFAGSAGLGLALGALVRKVPNKLFAIGYVVVFFAMLTTLTIGGHRGASLTHGDAYLTQHAPESIRGFLESVLGVEVQPTVATAEEIAAIPVAAREAYAHAVAPLLSKYCADCHGKGLQKGGVRLDSYFAILTVIDSSDPEESALTHRVMLPMDDEDHMPPPKKPQLSEPELRILTAWVAAGAPQNARLGDGAFNALLDDTATREALEAIASNAVAAPQSSNKTNTPPVDPEARMRLEAIVEPIADALGNSALIFEAQTGTNLHFQAPGLKGSLDAEVLKALQPVAEFITEMDMSLTATDGELLKALPNLPNLQRMTLSSTIIGDDAIEIIAAQCPALNALLAFNTELTDAAIPTLEGMTSLRNLVVSTTNMTEEALQGLGERRPELSIVQ